MVMTRKKLLRIIDREKIKVAIESAEHRTSGEICVSVAPLFWGNIEKAANKAFVRLGMANTKDRNGVLFFVVPARRKFVVLGDRGIHERVGQDFWHAIAAAVSEKFRAGGFTGSRCSSSRAQSSQRQPHCALSRGGIKKTATARGPLGCRRGATRRLVHRPIPISRKRRLLLGSRDDGRQGHGCGLDCSIHS